MLTISLLRVLRRKYLEELETHFEIANQIRKLSGKALKLNLRKDTCLRQNFDVIS